LGWRASLNSPSTDRWDTIRSYVEAQRAYLRNPLDPQSWICPVCRGIRAEGYARCSRCQTHYDLGGPTIADLVVPISYSPRNGQHHHHLRTYKGSPPSRQAQWNLLALMLLFLNDHLDCLAKTVGARPTHVITVPSTRGRTGQHPLAALLAPRLRLPWIIATANSIYGVDDRDFHHDWFRPTIPSGPRPVHVLVIEDTWTTGARAQSLAYALKTNGAATVSLVVLGRHVNPEYGPAKRLLETITDTRFDPNTCAFDSDSPRPRTVTNGGSDSPRH
jgi:predicted amidophosphoribosyltransferase